MWKPIHNPGNWPQFLKRKDNLGLPLMEVRKKYLKEQVEYDNYVSYVTANYLSAKSVNKGPISNIAIPSFASLGNGDLDVRFLLNIDNQSVPVETSYSEMGVFNDKPYYEIQSADPSFFPNRYIFWNIPQDIIEAGTNTPTPDDDNIPKGVGWFDGESQFNTSLRSRLVKKYDQPIGAGWVMGSSLRSTITDDSPYLIGGPSIDFVYWEASSMIHKEYAHLPNPESPYMFPILGVEGTYSTLEGRLKDVAFIHTSGSLTYGVDNITVSSSNEDPVITYDTGSLPSRIEFSYVVEETADPSNIIHTVTNKTFYKVLPTDNFTIDSGSLTEDVDRFVPYFEVTLKPTPTPKDYHTKIGPIYISDKTLIDDSSTTSLYITAPEGDYGEADLSLFPETIIAYLNDTWQLMHWDIERCEYYTQAYAKGSEWLNKLDGIDSNVVSTPATTTFDQVWQIREATSDFKPVWDVTQITGFRYTNKGDLDGNSYNPWLLWKEPR